MQFIIITTLCALLYCLPMALPVYIEGTLKQTISLTTLLPDEQLLTYFTLYEEPRGGKPGYGSDQQLFPEFCIFAGHPCSISYLHSQYTPVQKHMAIYGYVLVSFSEQPRNSSEFATLVVWNTLYLHLWTNFEDFKVYKSYSKDQELLNRTIEDVRGQIMEMRNTDPTHEMKLATVFGHRAFTLQQFRDVGNGTQFVIPDPKW